MTLVPAHELWFIPAAITPSRRRWMFLLPGESCNALPPADQLTIVVRVSLN